MPVKDIAEDVATAGKEVAQGVFESAKATIVAAIGDKGFDISMNIIAGIIAILFYFLIGKIIERLVNNFFEKSKKSQRKYRLDDRRLVTLNAVSLSIVKYTFYFFIVARMITVFGGEMNTSIIAIAGAGSVAIGFGAQSFIKDIITGFFLLLEDQLAVGDVVSITGTTGTVEAIGIRTTKLRCFNGDLYTIPNGQISIVNNMSKNYKRAIVEIRIRYEDNVEEIIKILEDEVENLYKEVSGFHEIPQVLAISSFNDSSVSLTIIAVCDIKENFRIEREIRKYVKIRLDKEGIIMPYPHRTVEVIK